MHACLDTDLDDDRLPPRVDEQGEVRRVQLGSPVVGVDEAAGCVGVDGHAGMFWYGGCESPVCTQKRRRPPFYIARTRLPGEEQHAQRLALDDLAPDLHLPPGLEDALETWTTPCSLTTAGVGVA
jgi:hypothetical protein